MTCLAILGPRSEPAHAAVDELHARCSHREPGEADVIVALGGDRFMLHCLHVYAALDKPIFGMNRGTLGFLMNEYRADGLLERIAGAREVKFYPLSTDVTTITGETHEVAAFNEVALRRDTAQSANIRITIDDATRIEKYVGDGVLVATSEGSTAYDRSVGVGQPDDAFGVRIWEEP